MQLATSGAGPVRLERSGAVASIIIDRPPVNALGAQVRAGLQDCVRQFLDEPGLVAAVLQCAGRSFSAGADITEFGHPSQPPSLPDLLLQIESAVKPIVAALHGTALGGGLELALACHGRVATETARLGLPEVKLGLLPGAGGTQRLPRLVGIVEAARMILDGDPVSATRALELGLVDRVVADDLLAAASELALTLAARPALRRTRDLPVGGSEPKFSQVASAALARARGAQAPARIVGLLQSTLDQPFDVGLARERAAFVEAAADPQSKALRHLFFAERKAGKIDGASRQVERPAVIGAGTMGVGIAIALADAGWNVRVVETEAAAIERANGRLDAHYEGQVRKGRLAADAAAKSRGAISLVTELGAIADADLVIEAIVENLAAKQSLLRTLDGLLGPDALLATNTSYLDVDAVMRDVRYPARTLGLHFFSPANVMRLLEVVRTAQSNTATLATAATFARRLGKLPVICGNATGFIGNRMLQAYGRESQLLLLEGAAPSQVDEALERFGMAMGPCAVYDLAGIDVGYRARRERNDLPDDPRYFRVSDALFEAGRLGQKAGRGSYRYRDDQGVLRREPDPDVTTLIEHEAAQLGITRRDVADDEIVERCILALVNEGARLLGERVATSAADIDVVWANGYGFPRWRGGPMHYAEATGLPVVLERVRALEQRLGSLYWRPAHLLVHCATTGHFDQ